MARSLRRAAALRRRSRTTHRARSVRAAQAKRYRGVDRANAVAWVKAPWGGSVLPSARHLLQRTAITWASPRPRVPASRQRGRELPQELEALRAAHLRPLGGPAPRR